MELPHSWYIDKKSMAHIQYLFNKILMLLFEKLCFPPLHYYWQCIADLLSQFKSKQVLQMKFVLNLICVKIMNFYNTACNCFLVIFTRCVAATVTVSEHYFLWAHPSLPGSLLPILRAVRTESYLRVQSRECHNVLQWNGGGR